MEGKQMRGYLVVLNTVDVARSGRAAQCLEQIQLWLKDLPEACRTIASHGRADFILYSECATGIDYNQRLRPGVEGVVLEVGPKLLWRPANLTIDALTGETQSIANNQRVVASGAETEVHIAHRADDGSVIIKTDLLNSSFVYMAQIDGLLLWSSSSRLLARLLRSRLHATSMAEFLVEGNVYGHRSIYEGIRLLPPSRVYRFAADGIESSTPYWSEAELPFESIGMGKARDRILAALDAEFDSMRASGRRMVLDLTGGYDSRMNVGMALRHRLDFRTIVAGDDDNGDVRVAQQVADRFGLDHRRVLPPHGELQQWQERIDSAFACTDGEYDLIEYAHIYNVHAAHYAADEVSVHGSTADLTRHYYFYPLQPFGHFPLERMIEKKFTPLVDSRRFLHPHIAMDWTEHMLARIAESDDTSLPAYVRLNNIYLRLRMQFWQGRISSSTNRIHASFTPWTSIPVLEAILTARWKDLENRRLTRQLVHDIHPGLDRVPMDGGSIAGIGPAAALRALPSAITFYARKIRQRLDRRRAGPPPAPRLAGLREFVAEHVGMLEGFLSAQAMAEVSAQHRSPTLAEPVLGKLYTLIRLQAQVDDWRPT